MSQQTSKKYNITILGYFGKSNLGDDLFRVAFGTLMSANPELLNLTFFEPTQPNISLAADTDALICGGGDIATDYFMNAVLRLKNEYESTHGKRLPTCAVSIGISFPENINETCSTSLDIFDHIIFRNKCDYTLLAERYGKDRVSYLPDLVFTVPRLLSFQPDVKLPSRRGKTLLICLAQSMSAGGKNPSYNHLVKKLTHVIQTASKKWDIKFMNFMTQRNDKFQCDHHLTETIRGKLTCRSTVVEEEDPVKVWRVFQKADRVFAMRFHAHVLAISTATPLVSLSMTNKTEYIIDDFNLRPCMVKMKIPERKVHYPVDFDAERTISLLLDDSLAVPVPPELPNPLAFFEHAMKGVLNHSPPEYLSPERVAVDTQRVVEVLASCVCRSVGIVYDPEVHPAELSRLRTLSRFYYKLTGAAPSVKDESLRNTLCALIELTLTGSDVTDFKYGLSEQIWSLNLGDSTEWILNRLAMTDGLPRAEALSGAGMGVSRCLASTGVKKPLSYDADGAVSDDASDEDEEEQQLRPVFGDDVRVDMSYIPQQVAKGYHRSGWKYVMDGLTGSYSGESPLIFDGYMDKTFHWSRDVSIEVGILPYRRPWVGIIHHTPSQEYTPYNTTDMVADPYFKASLPLCQGIIVMSEYMKVWLEDQGITVPIFTLTHPTLFVEDKCFSLDAFFLKQKRQIVQVGGWLRDSYAIFALNTDPTIMCKMALKGKSMDNYFPCAEQTHQYEETEQDDCATDNTPQKGCIEIDDGHQEGCITSPHACPKKSSPRKYNKYYLGLEKFVDERERSVQIVERLDDDGFDTLLTESIVFLKLEEASACNTVIECIVRNTPVLVNRIPALEEVLGKEYPFFYGNLSEAARMAQDANAVVHAHLYLVALDKTRFRLDTFLDGFGSIIENTLGGLA